MKYLLALIVVCSLTSCQVITTQQGNDIVQSAKQIDADVMNNMPPGPARDAAQKNAEAIGVSLGQPFTMTVPPPTVPASKP